MVNDVMTYAAYIILLIVSMFVYVFLVSCVFTRLLGRRSGDRILDRGVKRYTFPEGRAIVYETAQRNGRYITKYALSSVNGEKYIKCLIEKKIASITYEVAAFDANDVIIETVAVREAVRRRGYTSDMLLPCDTAYVSVTVTEVNGKPVARGAEKSSVGMIGAYAALTVAFTAVEVLLIKRELLNIAELAFGYSDKVASGGWFFSFVTALIAGAAVTVAGLFGARKRGGR